MGGDGKEQETLGLAPSSKVHCSTVLKHLQLLRKDDFLETLGFSNLRLPPKRGAPGVAGVEGTDETSSLSIFSF